ncbi:oleate hydratase [Dyadobacter sp. 676]|uniref:Oleate hydratase n=1 Tax=Dyadobacter sp. 676 TaxID=3088362 RepID=A0AAU8FPP3_9BACT
MLRPKEGIYGNVDGTDVLTTLNASNWQISIYLPYQPYFLGQAEHITVFWDTNFPHVHWETL